VQSLEMAMTLTLSLIRNDRAIRIWCPSSGEIRPKYLIQMEVSDPATHSMIAQKVPGIEEFI
jgi:hypothetical protein